MCPRRPGHAVGGELEEDVARLVDGEPVRLDGPYDLGVDEDLGPQWNSSPIPAPRISLSNSAILRLRTPRSLSWRVIRKMCGVRQIVFVPSFWAMRHMARAW